MAGLAGLTFGVVAEFGTQLLLSQAACPVHAQVSHAHHQRYHPTLWWCASHMYRCLLLLLQLLCDCRDCPGMGTYDKVVSGICTVSVEARVMYCKD
jgi:hypothetical protein